MPELNRNKVTTYINDEYNAKLVYLTIYDDVSISNYVKKLIKKDVCSRYLELFGVDITSPNISNVSKIIKEVIANE